MSSEEEFISVDVTSLFTSVPIDKALVVLEEKLAHDKTWESKTKLHIKDIVKLTGMCLNCTYFKYNNVYYKQIHGAAMGSPLSPVIANLYMESLEEKALSTMTQPPRFYMRYVDDTFMINIKQNRDSTLKHLNSIDKDIQFTHEVEENSSLPFLDALVNRNSEGKIIVSVYKKSTHTDQYLNYKSEHPQEHKNSVINTLMHRAEHLCTMKETQEEEKESVRKALNRCGYPRWVIARREKERKKIRPERDSSGEKKNKGLAVIPYVKGLGEKIRRVLQSENITTAFKPHTTLRNMLVAPMIRLNNNTRPE